MNSRILFSFKTLASKFVRRSKRKGNISRNKIFVLVVKIFLITRERKVVGSRQSLLLKCYKNWLSILRVTLISRNTATNPLIIDNFTFTRTDTLKQLVFTRTWRIYIYNIIRKWWCVFHSIIALVPFFHCTTDRYQGVTKWEKLSLFLAKRICSPLSRINTLHADNNFTFYLIRNCCVDLG